MFLASGLLSIMNSLAALGSFDHNKCDAILMSRGISIVGVFSPGNRPPLRNTLYLNAALLVSLLLFWITLVLVAVTRPRLPRSLKVAIFSIVALMCAPPTYLLVYQVTDMATYSNLCRQLLSSF
jgi:CBS domain containing-hemolysin-like protein